MDGGYGDDVATDSLVSGVWTSAFSLGNFLGPTSAGFLYDQLGFRGGTVVVQGLWVVAGLVAVVGTRGNTTGAGGYQVLRQA